MSTRSMDEYASFGTKMVGFGKTFNYNWPDRRPTDPLPEPLVFIKPMTSYVAHGGQVGVPRGGEILHEAELAIVIGKQGRDIPLSEAEDYVAGYALVLDLAEKETQAIAMKEGRSWSIGKGMDGMAPLGRFIDKSEIPDISKVRIKLDVDGRPRSYGNIANLIYSVAQLVAYTSSIFTLQPGDILMTGTPEWPAVCHAGERLTARMEVDDKLLDTLEVDLVGKKSGYRRDGGYWLDLLEDRDHKVKETAWPEAKL